MIEISGKESPGELELIVNGLRAQEGDEFYFVFSPNATSIGVEDPQLADKLLALCDLPPKIFSVDVPCPSYVIEDPDILKRVHLYRDFQKLGHYILEFEVSFEFEDWKKFWSPADYGRSFKEHFVGNAPEDCSLEFADNEFVSDGFTISTRISNEEEKIGVEVSQLVGIVKAVHEATFLSLASQPRAESVTTLFDFPEEVRVPCEQYLLFFVQFLKDLGVEATAELREQSGHVLFAVTPTNKEEALGKIRTALETYLCLPIGNLSGGEGNASLEQLASNVYHLKSQLALAHAILQAKDATIHAQRFTIIQQQHLLSGEVLVSSLRQVTSHAEDDGSEQVLGGIAEITTYEGKGFNVNLPEIYRRLRRLFHDEQAG